MSMQSLLAPKRYLVPPAGAERRRIVDPADDPSGCPWKDVRTLLRRAGLRPTRQRLVLGWLLFGKGNRHVTAEQLHHEAHQAKVFVSLATVYNTLHQFTEHGLLRPIATDASKAYFDTNVGDHHHFFIEGEDEVVDIADGDALISGLPKVPEGYEIARLDVVVRLRRKV